MLVLKKNDITIESKNEISGDNVLKKIGEDDISKEMFDQESLQR